MIRSASGTYSLPSACMKSYWVSTSQKMTRAMAGNLSDDTGACQQERRRKKSLPALEFEDFGQPVRARLGDQGREQRAADARPLPIRTDGEGGELREVAGVNLERSATDDLARRGLRDDVFLDVPAEVVVAARQQVAGLNVRSHEGFELRHVCQHRFSERQTGESRSCVRRCSLLPEDG